VAILLADAVRERLATETERLRALAPAVAWVARDNVHLTLKFLGGVEAGRLDAIAAALAEAATASAAFELEVRDLGAFPSRTRPRVLWAGVGEGAEAAASLAGRIDSVLARLDVPPESRAFSAHVTLGRVRVPRPNPRLAEALGGGVFGRQGVDHLSLMRSDLSPRGARYTELAVLPLGPRVSGAPRVAGIARAISE
jgi:RNA 2',3'-cyclic 3'-phosphodiesterase